MDDAPVVRGVERIQDLLGQCDRLRDRHRSPQRFALDELHDEVVGPDVVERADMRMIERGNGASLALKTS